MNRMVKLIDLLSALYKQETNMSVPFIHYFLIGEIVDPLQLLVLFR